MKFVVVNQHPSVVTGGSEIQCGFISDGLRSMGHQVTYVAPVKVMGERPPLSGVVWVPLNPSDIAAAIVAEQPNAVYWRFNLHGGFLDVARLLHSRGIPIVFAVSHINDVTRGAIKPLSGFRAKAILGPFMRLKALREFGGFRYVSELTVNNKSHLGRAPVASQHFIPNGMVADIQPFSWPRPYCAWVGNIKRSKRPEVAVRLASDLDPLGVDLLIVGNMQSDHYGWLENPEKRPANCHYLGGKTLLEVNGILAGSELHVHTCEPEGFSNVFIQAWLQGRPSVSYGFDPAGYIASNGIGIDADNDFSTFTDAVRKLLNDADERIAMGKRAKAFAEETFSVGNLVRRVESVLLKAALGRG